MLVKHTIWMIITFSKQLGLMESNVVKMKQHPLHRDIAPIKFASKHKRAIATTSELFISIDLNVTHLDNRRANGLHIIRGDGENIGLQIVLPILVRHSIGCANSVVDGFGGRLVSKRQLGLRELRL